MRRADDSSRGVLPTVVCLGVIVKPQYYQAVAHWGAVAPWQKKTNRTQNMRMKMALHGEGTRLQKYAERMLIKFGTRH